MNDYFFYYYYLLFIIFYSLFVVVVVCECAVVHSSCIIIIVLHYDDDERTKGGQRWGFFATNPGGNSSIYFTGHTRAEKDIFCNIDFSWSLLTGPPAHSQCTRVEENCFGFHGNNIWERIWGVVQLVIDPLFLGFRSKLMRCQSPKLMRMDRT